jgi:hypothetical protein
MFMLMLSIHVDVHVLCWKKTCLPGMLQTSCMHEWQQPRGEGCMGMCMCSKRSKWGKGIGAACMHDKGDSVHAC